MLQDNEANFRTPIFLIIIIIIVVVLVVAVVIKIMFKGKVGHKGPR